jgi:hypothetical protein
LNLLREDNYRSKDGYFPYLEAGYFRRFEAVEAESQAFLAAATAHGPDIARITACTDAIVMKLEDLPKDLHLKQYIRLSH